MIPDGTVLLYDGTCGFCARTVQFVLDHEGPRHTLRFAPLDGPLGAEARRQHPELEHIDSVVLVLPTDHVVLVKSRAALAVGAYLGGVWRVLAAIGRLVPAPISDAVYDAIARRRHRIAGDDTSCLIPSAEQRRRFESPAQP